MQAILAREAAALLNLLTPRQAEGAGLWHFLEMSGEMQLYAAAMLRSLQAWDVELLEKRREDVGAMLRENLRRVVPPPAVERGGQAAAMKALDREVRP